MSRLSQIVRLLSPRERAEVANHLKKGVRRQTMLKLFNLLCSEKNYSSKQLVRRICGEENDNAYKDLERKLNAVLFDYITSRRQDPSLSDRGIIMAHLIMAEFLFERSAVTLAGTYLQKAQTLMVQRGRPEMLELIYQMQLEHCADLGLSFVDITAAWRHHVKLYECERRLQFYAALVRERISQARLNGQVLDPVATVNMMTDQLDIEAHRQTNAPFMFRYVSMMRSVMLSNKNYDQVETLVTEAYETLKAHDAFVNGNQEYELGFVYMITHAKYRMLRFAEAEHWLKKMEDLLPGDRFKSSHLGSSFIGLKAAIACNTGNNSLAIECLAKELENSSLGQNRRRRLDMRLNLAVCYFQDANYRQSLRALHAITHEEDGVDELMGREWCMKREMVEMIVLTELGHCDLALDRIAAIRRQYASMFVEPLYKRAHQYLHLVEQIILDPLVVREDSFTAEVETLVTSWVPFKPDLQAITFFCWIRSKMSGRNYYEVLIERLSLAA